MSDSSNLFDLLSPEVLAGDGIRLERLHSDHLSSLAAVADDERIWKLTNGGRPGQGFEGWFEKALTGYQQRNRIPFVVRLASGPVVGSSSFFDPVSDHRRVEIGATWYHPDYWGTVVNSIAKEAMLRHAFEIAGANRVEFVTDVLNVRSRGALEGIGATYEGTLRSHMVMNGGRVRDSAMFSIVRSEWPIVKTALLQRIGQRPAAPR